MKLLKRKPGLVEVDAPFLMDPKDPAFNKARSPRLKPRKVLTSLDGKSILKRVKNKRKDDKTMATKAKIQTTNYMQTGAIALLALAAIEGVTELLGGSLRAVAVAALLVAVLYAQAVDYRK